MKLTFLASLLFYCIISQAQVGIGTTTPSTNSALDVNSANKGIMLPRVPDTTNVANPSAGLMIYDVNAKAPAFHDGVKWSNVASRSTQSTTNDSITYTITNPARMGLFAAGTFHLQAVAIGGQQAMGPNFTLQFTKSSDVNSIAFAKAFATNMSLATMIIEIKVYQPGATGDPYYSFKLTGPKLLSFSTAISNSDMELYESYAVEALVYGFKNWTNGTGFSYTVASGNVGTY